MPEKWTASEKPWGRGGAVLVEQGKMAKHLTHFVKKKNGRTFALKDSNNDMNIT